MVASGLLYAEQARKLFGMNSSSAAANNNFAIQSKLQQSTYNDRVQDKLVSTMDILAKAQVKSLQVQTQNLELMKKLAKNSANSNSLGITDLIMAKFGGNLLQKIGGGLLTKTSAMFTGMGGAFGGSRLLGSTILGGAKQFVGNMLTTLGTTAAALLKNAGSSLLSGGSKLLELAPKALGILGKIGSKVFLPLTGLLSIFDGWKGWSNAGELLGKDASKVNLWDKVSASVGSIVNGLLLGIPNWIAGKLGVDNIEQLLNKAGYGIYDFFTTTIPNLAYTLASNIGSWVGQQYANIKEYFPAVTTFESVFSGIADKASATVMTVANFVSDSVSYLGSKLSDAMSGISEWFKKQWGYEDAPKVPSMMPSYNGPTTSGPTNMLTNNNAPTKEAAALASAVGSAVATNSFNSEINSLRKSPVDVAAPAAAAITAIDAISSVKNKAEDSLEKTTAQKIKEAAAKAIDDAYSASAGWAGFAKDVGGALGYSVSPNSQPSFTPGGSGKATGISGGGPNAGTSVTPATGDAAGPGGDLTNVDPNALKFIRSIGARETGFNYKEAYTDKYNQPGNNTNVGKYGASGADYGYYQVNQMDVDQAIKLGVPPDVAKNLMHGNVQQQTYAMNEYLKRLNPEGYAAAQRGDWDTANRAFNGKWPSLPGGKSYRSSNDAAAADALAGKTTPGMVVQPKSSMGNDASPENKSLAQAFGDMTNTDRTYQREPGISGEFNAATMTGEYGAPGTNLTKIRLADGHTVTVNAATADRFKGFIDTALEAGYKLAPGTDGVDGYVYRNKRGSNELSQHSWGTAVDINPDKNGMDGRNKSDIPVNMEKMAPIFGLSPGRKFGDGMHFEAMSKKAWDTYLDSYAEQGIGGMTKDKAELIKQMRDSGATGDYIQSIMSGKLTRDNMSQWTGTSRSLLSPEEAARASSEAAKNAYSKNPFGVGTTSQGIEDPSIKAQTERLGKAIGDAVVDSSTDKPAPQSFTPVEFNNGLTTQTANQPAGSIVAKDPTGSTIDTTKDTPSPSDIRSIDELDMLMANSSMMR